MFEHGLHPRALNQAAGDIIRENGFDFVAFVFRVFSAAGFLRAQAIAPSGLRLVGHTAVNDCLNGFIRHA